MSDFISRSDALNFEMEIEVEPDEIQAITKGMALMSEYIKGLPAADIVERKHGKWINGSGIVNGHTYPFPECSVCGKLSTILYKPDYCPNCGALMEKSE